MQFLQNIKLIQGGMGVYVSKLAAGASRRHGTTRRDRRHRLRHRARRGLCAAAATGDPGGHARRALSAFDAKFGATVGRSLCDRYFIEGGKAPDAQFRSAPMQVVRSAEGKFTFPAANGATAPIPLTLDDSIIELLIATGFAEVWLAKEGHSGNIFINFLNKIELPLIYVMYGAMLAGVDGDHRGRRQPRRPAGHLRQPGQS